MAAPPAERLDAQAYFLGGRAAARSPRQIARLTRTAIRLSRRASPRLFTIVIAVQLVGALLVGLQILLARAGIAAVLEQANGAGDVSAALPPLVGLAIAAALGGLITSSQTHLQRLLGEKVQWASWTEILAVTTSVGLARFESPEFFDDLQRVRVNALSRPLTLVTGLVQVIGAVVTVVVLAVALFAVEPLLLPVFAAGAVPMWWLARRSGRLEFAFAVDQTPQRRRRTYLEDVLSSRDEAKEIRAFDLGGTLIDRWQRDYGRYFRDLDRHIRTRLLLAGASALVTAVATTAALALLVWLVFDGRVALASAAVALITIRLLGGRIQQLLTGIGALFESSLFMRDLEMFLARAEPPDAGGPARPRAETLREVSAEDVSFRYPGAHRDALTGVSISVKAGEVVALVGENGSGKTTLAKLLALLFEPAHGSVRWNGEDARGLDPVTLRPQIGVIFQDFVRYQLSARENVGLGRWEAEADLEAIAAAASRAGAHDDLNGLPHGYETTLGKEFFGGHDLSGGQWQRVALARVFFRDPALLILDEPTAALDARSEHAVFERVRELERGRSVLLISHRFSTVMSADRIYVLQGGRVIEHGSHEQLMELGGHYAELFELQARAYR